MRLKVIVLFVVSLLCLISANGQTLNQSRSSVVLNEKTADIRFVIDNSKSSFNDTVSIELLDKENKVRAETSEHLNIKKGIKTYAFSLPLGNLMQTDENIIWYRLRYKIGNRSEIISLSELVRDNFELRVIASNVLLSGMTYRSRIRAINPLNDQSVKDVNVTAKLKMDVKGEDKEPLIIKANGKTDKDGFVILDFQIPSEILSEEDGKLEVFGKKNGLIREANEEIEMATDDYNFLMLTDKPIYQPEQELKIRGILLKGSEGQVTVANENIEFKIEDEEDTLIYREVVKTSEFGVASISWKIPENAKLGDYSIRVKTTNNFDGRYAGHQKIKVSRYDLPNFVVNPKPEKKYYLPEEKEAEIEVRADYLFGKPVTKGKVRVVEEKSREWNWKEQKYEIDEGQIREGEVDSEGKFTAKVDLKEAHEDLKEDDWRKFKNLNFTAYFTDLTTNKTEQRRFDIRVTKEAIHVYYIGESYDFNPKLPINGYISTFYADGSPAICDVVLKVREEDSEEDFKTVKRLKTNSYGAGKFEFKAPKFDGDYEDLGVRIFAIDAEGKKGTFGNDDDDDEEIYLDEDDDILQIRTQKSIYKAGESVKIKINSNMNTGLVYVDIVKGWSVVDSYFVNLKKGKAELKIPYQDNFQGVLKIAAFHEKDDDEMVRTSRGVIFPTPQNLQLDAKFDKESYKPSEEATLNFSVLDSVGNAIESALGVVIFDKAVEERARTDSEFGGMFGNFYDWLGYGESFGSVNVKDLNELDVTKPISDELQLVAEVMLHDNYYYPNIFHSRNYETDAKSVYSDFFKQQFDPIEKALNETYKNEHFKHPTNDASLAKILNENGLDVVTLRDPWDQKYRVIFDIKEVQNTIKIETSGADKKFDTDDDFTVLTQGFNYFTSTGNTINTTIANYHKRTNKFIRDRNTLLKELGVSELKDRFGNPYVITFDVYNRNYRMKIRSAGKDGKIESYSWRGDDFDVWTNQIDYFADTEQKISEILKSSQETPVSEKEFTYILSKKGLEIEQIKDGYGQNIYLLRAQFSRYHDKVEVENVSVFGEDKVIERKKITPVTQEVVKFTLRSKGEDGNKGTYSDFTLAQYQFVISEQTKDDEKPKEIIRKIAFIRGAGSISGTITDSTGAAIPGANISATNEISEASRISTSNENGQYLIANLSAGNYTVTAEATGFQSSVRSSVPVTADNVTEINMSLSVAGSSAMVNVDTSGAVTIDNSDTKIDSNITSEIIDALPKGTTFGSLLKLAPNVRPEALGDGFQIDGASGSENIFVIDGKKFVKNEYGKLTPFSEKSTPRLREYFPETLLWNPEVITDKNGKAEVKFKMADSITTWKLYTIASTKTGKIGVVEKEVAAFKAFFVDLDPPKFLTEGDEIYLPTQVRNYTKDKQNVNVTMAKSDWFSFLDAEKKEIRVASGESENAVFGFKANSFIKGGKQKVTAIADTDSDAIEKPVTVRPNGQEVIKTESKLFRNNATFGINFPANSIVNTPKAEVKIYPNLLAHVAESVEGLLQRPYGCGEQTISSTYPNLMILKFGSGKSKEDKASTPLQKLAKNFLQKGYERLLGYQVTSGGISYWGGSEAADIALTAYAIRFLNDAQSEIEVDRDVIKRAEDWLISQQRADGSWTQKYSYETSENRNRTTMLTAYVTRTLALAESKNTDALTKALSFLKTRNAEIDEPYALALYGLASLELGNIEQANSTAQKLFEMAISEGGGVYWNLETNTPFYGWGKAGRIETTALVVQLLVKVSSLKSEALSPTNNSKLKTQDLIAKGTQFLLKNKDRYGVWYSTQTTINVLDTFLATLSGDEKTDSTTKRTAEIFVNGQIAKTFELPPSNELASPINLKISSLLTLLNNRVEIKTNDNSSIMSQVVQEHYIDWQDATISNRETNQSRQIRLDYSCDKQNVAIMQDVTCDVKAERIGFKSYGMLLAEIGIPPGADVSRESLEDAFKDDWSLSRYDILPDRIIVYMWSKAGGTGFKFKFKPRYGINAQTPASFVYDYYNEEAKATIAPMRFEVKSN